MWEKKGGGKDGKVVRMDPKGPEVNELHLLTNEEPLEVSE